MKRLALALALAALAALPAAVPAAGCSPLDCASSQLPLAGGRLLAVHAGGIEGNVRVLDLRTGKTRWWLPPGMLGGDLLVHKDGALLTWFNARSGARVASAVADLRGAFALVGSSQDGREAVLARTERRRTTVLIVSPGGQRRVVLGGNRWSFDALAGHSLYLIHALRSGYQVRLYDLAGNRLAPKPLKDPGEPAVIKGAPWERLSSPDRRYLFTLYLGSDGGAMIHELDLSRGIARCIDLPGTGDFNAAGTYALALSADGRTLWAVSPGYGRLAAIDVRAHRLRLRFAFAPGPWSGNARIAALSPDGKLLAVTDAQHIWFVELAQRRVSRARPHVAIAIGVSTGGKKLWMVGQRSRVSSLPAAPE